MLVFGKANAKLIRLQKKIGKQIYTFSLLSGHTCPYAKECQSFAVLNEDNKLRIKDGPHTLFRCYSASQEVLFPSAYKAHSENQTKLLVECKNDIDSMRDLILESIPKKAAVIRVHQSGDFKTQNYFNAWIRVSELKPKLKFYAYTKSLPFWVKRINDIPRNFSLTASYGGWKDELIEKNDLRYVKVVHSVKAARSLKLPIDHDDSHALKRTGNFALLIHGTQPKDSEAGKAVKKLNGLGSYGKGLK